MLRLLSKDEKTSQLRSDVELLGLFGYLILNENKEAKDTSLKR